MKFWFCNITLIINPKISGRPCSHSSFVLTIGVSWHYGERDQMMGCFGTSNHAYSLSVWAPDPFVYLCLQLVFPSCQDKSRQVLALTNGQPVIEKLVWSYPNREISAPRFKDSGSNGSKHKAVHLFIILSLFPVKILAFWSMRSISWKRWQQSDNCLRV